MASTSCPQCGTFLLPGDSGRCPVCRQAVPTTGAEEIWDDVEADAPPAPSGETFGPDQEAAFQQACALLRQPEPAAAGRGLWLILTLVAFVLASRQDQSPLQIAMLVGTLFFHELGHWLGMVIFGYRDVKMFFIPFFGAAVSGRKEGAPQWQQAIVLLLGPLPGIILGCGLLAWNLAEPNATVRNLAVWLVVLNAFNLLPIGPLDGARFLNIVVFSRHPLLETVFMVATSVATIGLAWLLEAWILLILGVIGLATTPVRSRIAGAAAAVRRRWPAMPIRIADASEPLLRDVFRAVQHPTMAKAKDAARFYANTMKQAYEKAQVRPASVLASLGLLVLYGGGFVLTLLAIVLLAAEVRPRPWLR